MNKTTAPVYLSTAYFPNIQYISKFLLHEKVIIDVNETFMKQSFRNRCVIYGANGAMDLSIPVVKPHGNKTITKDILIDYDTKWHLDHWRAIKSAYGNSPFFEIFEPEIAPLFSLNEKYLIDFNHKALLQIAKSLDICIEYGVSSVYLPENNITGFDFRNSIHPKARMQKNDQNFSPAQYYQVFSKKKGFIPNLSFIDLMFNEGSNAIAMCKKSIVNP